MTYATCIFCNRNDSKPSKEDVLARWIAREFPDAEWTIHQIESNRRKTLRKNLGIISRAPCARCNNTWMSRLESQAQPILGSMMQGVPCVLAADDQLAIAKWLMKTAVVYERHNKKNPEYYFTAVDCNSLMNSNSMPFDDTRIFLARRDNPETTVATRESRRGMKLPNRYDHFLEMKSYTATFGIKHLALQIFTLRRAKEFGNKPLHVGIPKKWRDVTIEIWPSGGGVQWPPRLSLDKSDFELFAKRWASPDVFNL